MVLGSYTIQFQMENRIWRVSYKRQELLTLLPLLTSPPVLVGPVLFIYFVFVLSYCVPLRSEFHVLMSITISAYKQCSIRLSS